MEPGSQFTSGNWVVKEGREDDFISRWTEFTEWTKSAATGTNWFLLIRDDADPRHFMSLGSWPDLDAVNSWRGSPEFAEKLGRCRELCDDFQAKDYGLSSQVG